MHEIDKICRKNLLEFTVSFIELLLIVSVRFRVFCIYKTSAHRAP